MLCVRRFLCRVTSYFSLVLLSFVTSECPESAMRDIKLCTASTLPNDGLGPQVNAPPQIALIRGKSMVRDSCKSSRFLEATECMENILDKCTGTTEQDQVLQRLFDKEKIEATLRYVCSNLDEYENSAECISQQRAEAANCTYDVIKSYQQKESAKATMDVLIHATCSFHESAYECLVDLVNNNCGNDAAVFMQTILLGTRPPACKELKEKYRSSGSTVYQQFSLIIVFCSVFISVSRYN